MVLGNLTFQNLTMTISNFCVLQEREERDGGVDAGHVRLRAHPEAPRARDGDDSLVRAPVGGDGGQEEHAELGQAEEQGGEEGLGQEDPRIQLAEVGDHRRP